MEYVDRGVWSITRSFVPSVQSVNRNVGFVDNKDADIELDHHEFTWTGGLIVEASLSEFRQQIHLIANTKGNTHTYKINVSEHDEQSM
jgi:hypothetical protein